jgi:CheY-like chemotaxis protein
MSHEIRTPMNAILGVTEILMQSDTLPADTMEGLDKIYISCDLLLGIINDILDFSKIEAGKLEILPAPYCVASLINDSMHLNMMRIGSKPIAFELHINENIPARLVGDELRIKQIINNLLSNAFKYTESGKVTLSVDFKLGDDPDSVDLVLIVQDTGDGMTKEQVNALFDEYTRFASLNKRVIEGTGLGMAITNRLLRLMDGEIQVESELGKGSLFTVRLPQQRASADVLGKELVANLRQFRINYMKHRKRAQIVRDPMPYGSVLIVDDVETNIYVAEGLLRLYGLQIDTAMSGVETIEKINTGKVYDIVFMDHMMPGMDGIEATKRLRDLGYTEPIVALTANAVAGQAEMFLQNGFDAFISKPIDIRQLNALLNKMIRDKQPSEVIAAARQQKGSAVVDANDDELSEINPLLLDAFMRDTRKAIAEIEELYESNGLVGDEGMQQLTITAHGMKSVLRNIGQADLSETARKLEEGGRERDVDLIATSIPSFLRDLRAVLVSFEETTDEGTDAADEDIGFLQEQLFAIQKACADYDRRNVFAIIEEIKQKKCSQETTKLLDSISVHVLHSEFDEVANVVEEYSALLKQREKM